MRPRGSFLRLIALTGFRSISLRSSRRKCVRQRCDVAIHRRTASSILLRGDDCATSLIFTRLARETVSAASLSLPLEMRSAVKTDLTTGQAAALESPFLEIAPSEGGLDVILSKRIKTRTLRDCLWKVFTLANRCLHRHRPLQRFLAIREIFTLSWIDPLL